MIDPPDLFTCSFTADTRPVRVLLVLYSPAVLASSELEIGARSASIGPDERIIWIMRTRMEARTA